MIVGLFILSLFNCFSAFVILIIEKTCLVLLRICIRDGLNRHILHSIASILSSLYEPGGILRNDSILEVRGHLCLGSRSKSWLFQPSMARKTSSTKNSFDRYPGPHPQQMNLSRNLVQKLTTQKRIPGQVHHGHKLSLLELSQCSPT